MVLTSCRLRHVTLIYVYVYVCGVCITSQYELPLLACKEEFIICRSRSQGLLFPAFRLEASTSVATGVFRREAIRLYKHWPCGVVE